MTVTALRAEMPNAEFIQWQAFYTWRAAEQEKAAKKAEAKRGRR